MSEVTRNPAIWKPIPGHEESYEASDHGRVRSLDRIVHHINGYSRALRGRLLSPVINPRSGHLTVILSRSGERRRRYVHQLVLEAFHGAMPEGMGVRHLDDEPTNNHLSNLVYGTQAENMQDMLRNGNNYQVNKATCKRGHPLEGANIVGNKSRSGWRECLACNRAQSYTRYHKHLRPQLQEIADSYYATILNTPFTEKEAP